MYCLSDEQIDFILNDIRARGVEMESLQQNLLDHVCCIIEENLEEGGDFGTFYETTIRTFFKTGLWEIEEETITLLTFKNYYAMKKVMTASGLVSAAILGFGILFKFNHWPWATFLIATALICASFIFLPLLFTLKIREQKSMRDKFVLVTGAVSSILVLCSFLFRIVMGSHYAVNLLYISTLAMLLIFLPVYFFSGIRQPESRTNTIISSVLIVLAYGLLLLLVRTPSSSRMVNRYLTQDFLRTQKILKMEQAQFNRALKISTDHGPWLRLGETINRVCEETKASILKYKTGSDHIDEDFEARGVYIEDLSFSMDDEGSVQKLAELSGLVAEYNAMIGSNKSLATIPVQVSFMNLPPSYTLSFMRVADLLNQVAQVQLFVLQNGRELLAEK